MMIALNKWLKIRTDRRGVTALEYALIAGLVGVVIVTGATSLGSSISAKFTSIAGTITSAK